MEDHFVCRDWSLGKETPLLSTLSTDDFQWFLYFYIIVDLNDAENNALLFGQVTEFQGFLESFEGISTLCGNSFGVNFSNKYPTMYNA